MCAAGRPEDDGYGLRIYQGIRVDAYLQRRSQLPGWTTVAWRGDHVAEPMDLSPEEAGLYWAEVLKVATALRQHFSPIKVNIQLLGNEVPHLHAHVTLRFADDPWPSRPLEMGAWANAYSDAEYLEHVSALRALLD
jgi:diadenosine tetraphosphate (Ap4A) HIT family hydrolase